jgi:hypothetical protein
MQQKHRQKLKLTPLLLQQQAAPLHSFSFPAAHAV